MLQRRGRPVSNGVKAVVSVLVLLTAVAAGLTLYVFRIGKISVMAANSTVTSYTVSESPERFDRDRTLASGNALHGAVLQDISYASADDLDYVFYSVRIRNNNLISAETVELTPEVRNGDILYYTQGEEETVINPFCDEDMTLVIMKHHDSGNEKRQIRITYYYMGEKREEMVVL